MAWAYRASLRAITRARGETPLTVLLYHRVLPRADPLRPGEPSAERFEMQLSWLKARFNVISLAEALHGLRCRALPARPLVITFDDGYADNCDLALPILKRLGVKATFFVATGYLDGGVMFNDVVIEAVRQARGEALDLSALGLGTHRVDSEAARRDAIGDLLQRIKYAATAQRAELAQAIAHTAEARVPTNLMMTSEQVAALVAQGMEVGAHTVLHPILKEVDIEVARAEIETGRKRLEQITGAPVRVFAYPNGRPGRDYAMEHVRLVRDLGFDAAVSTAWGTATPGADFYQIPRVAPWDPLLWRFGLRLARTIATRDFATA